MLYHLFFNLFSYFFHTADPLCIRSYALFYVTSSVKSTLQTDSLGYFFVFLHCASYKRRSVIKATLLKKSFILLFDLIQLCKINACR